MWGARSQGSGPGRGSSEGEGVEEEDPFFHPHVDGELGHRAGAAACGRVTWWDALPLPLFLVGAVVAKGVAAGGPPLAAALRMGDRGLLTLALAAYRYVAEDRMLVCVCLGWGRGGGGEGGRCIDNAARVGVVGLGGGWDLGGGVSSVPIETAS